MGKGRGRDELGRWEQVKVNESGQPDLLRNDFNDQDWPAMGSSLSPERQFLEVNSIFLNLIY